MASCVSTRPRLWQPSSQSASKYKYIQCPAPDIVSAIRALATVTINKFALPIQDIKTETKLDFSGKELGVEDAIVIAALIPLNVSSTEADELCTVIIRCYYFC